MIMDVEEIPFSELLSTVIDNRGKTCPTTETGIPLIATNCIRNELLYPTYDKVRFVSKQTYDTWFRSHPEPGDIIFVNKATPGRVCLVPDPVDFCIAQDMVAVRANPKRVYHTSPVCGSAVANRSGENWPDARRHPHPSF